MDEQQVIDRIKQMTTEELLNALEDEGRNQGASSTFKDKMKHGDLAKLIKSEVLNRI